MWICVVYLQRSEPAIIGHIHFTKLYIARQQEKSEKHEKSMRLKGHETLIWITHDGALSIMDHHAKLWNKKVFSVVMEKPEALRAWAVKYDHESCMQKENVNVKVWQMTSWW